VIDELRFYQVVNDSRLAFWPFVLAVNMDTWIAKEGNPFNAVVDWCEDSFGQTIGFLESPHSARWTFHPRTYRIALRSESDFFVFRLRWM
jgi:hypothetical protein